MSSTEQALAVTNQDIKSLTSSKFFKPTLKGLDFKVDEEGKLVHIPHDEIVGLTHSLKIFNQAHTWWAGDAAAAIKDLYGPDAVAEFYDEVGLEPEYGDKLMSISRSFGFPGKTHEMRHPDPRISHQHHIHVMGFKDPGVRLSLLDDAAREGMTVSKFIEHVKEYKARQPGKKVETPEPEFPVLHAKFHAFDPKVESQEEYAQAFLNFVQTTAIPEYFNPELRKVREQQEKREKIAEVLPEGIRVSVLAENATLSLDEFETLVGILTERTKDMKKKESLANTIKDDDEVRAKFLERAKNQDEPLEDFQKATQNAKALIRSRKKDADKISKLIDKINDEAKRAEIHTLAAEQKLVLAQVEAIVRPIITDQDAIELKERLREENEEKIQKRVDAWRAKALEPKKPKTEEVDLPIGKGGKKTSKKKPAPEAIA